MSKPFRTLEGLFRLDNFMFPAFGTLVIASCVALLYVWNIIEQSEDVLNNLQCK